MRNVISKLVPSPTSKIPLRQDKSLNVLMVLKTVVPLFVQHDMENAAKFSYKTAPGKVNNASNERVPRESAYQQQLVSIFAKWLGAIDYEVIGQYHTREALGYPRYCDVVLTAPDNTPAGILGATTILELLATSTNSEPREHYERALEYAEILKIRYQQSQSTQVSSANNSPQSLNMRDIWVVHFTCEDGANSKENCSWPSKEQQAKNLNAVVFWHNLDFTEIRMSACWKDYEGETMQEVYDELIYRRE